MEFIPTVENPRRRRRRHYTAKQRAAGFGGKRYRRRTVRRRRNPALATLAANPRRRRHYRASVRRFHRRRYRNPSILGLGGITNMIDLKTAGFVAGGMIGVKLAPALLRKVWANAPSTGVGGYAVKLGAVFALGMLTRMVTKNSARAGQVVAGALGLTLYEIFNEYVGPRLGLSGLAMNGYIPTAEMRQVISGYVPTPVPVRGPNYTAEILAA